jgi:O-antigen ligase/polysaccharide polymerase Wzy-like membrane protein
MRRAFDRWAARLLLGAGGLLAAVSSLLSSGSSNGRLVWIGLAALAVATAVAAGAFVGLPRPALGRGAVAALLLLIALVTWMGISVTWSIEPDRSWDYLNRGLVYLALISVGVAVGSFVSRAAYTWAYVLAAALALPLGWALLTKAFPGVGSGSGRVARLSAPVGYWNALALLFAMALPLALWLAARREHAHWLRALAVVYVFALVVGLTLTYSRGGVLAGGVAALLWIVLGRPRVESAAALLLGGGAGLGVAVWAFSQPGLADDGQSHSVRVHDGAWFAVVFVLAALFVGALAYLGSLAEERRPLDDRRRRLVGQVALGVLVVGVAAAAVGVAVETKPTGWFKEFTAQPTNANTQEGPQRLATVNSSSRWLWWKEAWHAFEDQPVRGTGAGTFELTHRLLRTNDIVVTEPHNLPLQFLSETGIVGLLLFLGFLAAAGAAVVRGVRRLDGIERPAAVALAIVLVAYLLHSLVDFDWDFVAVSGPFFLTLGVLLGGGVAQEESRPWLAPLPVAIAVAFALSLLTPWFAQRDTDAAVSALADGRPLQAYRHGRDARSLNPLAIDPIFWQALALEQLGDFQGERQLYIDAVRLQPLNWRTWLELGEFEERQQDHTRAIPPLKRAVQLDPQSEAPRAELEKAQQAAR